MSINEYDILVIGCGITGAAIARDLAEKGKKVLIWERRDHIGGNMYDYVNNQGIRVHKYGPHVFHTSDPKVKNYVEKFGEWTEFRVCCRAEILGKLTPSPFNFQTIDDYYSLEDGYSLKRKLLNYFHGREKATIVEMLSSDDKDIKQYADFLYENDYALYTSKQWGIAPEYIDSAVLARVPVYLSYKDGCFEDIFQMVPIDGYTSWFNSLLNHENISVCLEIEALDHLKIEKDTTIIDGVEYTGIVVYTGPLDELFCCKFCNLPYRSLRFTWEYEDNSHHQVTPLVVYPSNKDYTRVTDYSYFPHVKYNDNGASFSFEYPVQYERGAGMEPYYPVQTDESAGIYTIYHELASKIHNLVCAGRLANFTYYNMDQALLSAFEAIKKVNRLIHY